jgi:hypothetical protein
MKNSTLNSSKITWRVMLGEACDDWTMALCADGDGMVQVLIYPDRVELQDQTEVCKTWLGGADLSAVLEAAQSYLAATYHDIFEVAQHHESQS